ncbi:MAG: hypothetical protein ACI9EM_000606 [Candidatus Thalassarchaeaceae archaeon]|jgi:hypothetical protein|tara:strand:- start:32147 stop:35437 length:3291 start_codon:yes stop_codon:yes gene_type:complete
MTKEWRALAALAAKKENLPKIDIDEDINNKNPNRKNNRKIGRRGGKGLRRGFEDNLATPEEVMSSHETPGYKLAVLIAQQNKMGNNWDSSLNDLMNEIRVDCQKGLHPVWSKLAKEAGLFAELSRFKVSESSKKNSDSSTWINQAYFDPEDTSELRKWLKIELPFNAKTEQLRIIQKIEKDLGKKPRYEDWGTWMDPSLKNQKKEFALIEGILMASSKNPDAIKILEDISEESMKDLADKHIRLLNIRSGSLSNWDKDSKIKGDDKLSEAIRSSSWKQINNIEQNLSISDLKYGIEALSKSGEKMPNSLGWKLVSELQINGKLDEVHELTKKLEIENNLHLEIALRLNSENDSMIGSLILSSIQNINDEGLLMITDDEFCDSKIKVIAAEKLSNLDSIRYTSKILDVFTETADIGNLSRILIKDSSLTKAYPERTLLVWHMISAESSVGLMPILEKMRRNALISISNSPKDLILSDISTELIGLLDGIPNGISAIQKNLDSEGLLSLNEVRRALSPEGDSMVRPKTVERLIQSIENANITYLENALFQCLVDSLLLNRAAMDIESGMENRIQEANKVLSTLTQKENVSMQTIKFITEMVIEHGKILSEGIEPLEKWYRKYDNNSLESKLVRATIQSSKSNNLEAAREYRDAANRVKDDFEKYALIMRKALISYAHGEGWKEAVNLIESEDALAASVTKRFQLYLNVCNDDLENNKDVARNRLRQYASKGIKETDEDFKENKEIQIEALEMLIRYPEDLDPPLPKSPFQGRVKAAIRGLQRLENSRQSDLDLKFEQELSRENKDILEIVKIVEKIAIEKPIRGLRKLERAIGSNKFTEIQLIRLSRAAEAMFGGYSPTIPIRDRKSLRNLSLKPVIIVDTNILIDALKDDLIREITDDNFGSLNWSVERSFHWMLRRRKKEGKILMNIPPVVMNEFLNRTKSPQEVLNLFSNKVYIDANVWNSKITESLLLETVNKICKEFGDWEYVFDQKLMKEIELEKFLLNHKNIFVEITNQKIKRDEFADRSIIEGEEIYPERGDMEIMRSAALIANSFNPEIGSIMIATRDSDFKLISRSLEEKYGFGVVGDAQELNRRVLH